MSRFCHCRSLIFVITTTLTILVVVGTAFVMPRLVIAWTPSLPLTLFWKSDDPSSEYALFYAPTAWRWEHLPPAERLLPFTKRIGCRPGDLLTMEENRYACNGSYLATAKEYSTAGKRLTPFQTGGVIPPDFYFMVGSHPDSFDSRYYGLIHQQYIISSLRGIL